jgi:hypothetical protein
LLRRRQEQLGERRVGGLGIERDGATARIAGALDVALVEE